MDNKEKEQERELYEGYLAMRCNPCWQWLEQGVLRRRDYLRDRLLQAENWTDYCAIRGQLEAMNSMLNEISIVASNFQERSSNS